MRPDRSITTKPASATHTDRMNSQSMTNPAQKASVAHRMRRARCADSGRDARWTK